MDSAWCDTDMDKPTRPGSLSALAGYVDSSFLLVYNARLIIWCCGLSAILTLLDIPACQHASAILICCAHILVVPALINSALIVWYLCKREIYWRILALRDTVKSPALAKTGRQVLEWLGLGFVKDLEKPTYEELLMLGYENLLPGKQCAHLVKDWFRGTKKPQRSRKAIFREIILAANIMDSEKERLLVNYICEDDWEAPCPRAPTFPRFRELPAELQVMIWEKAVLVPRLVDVTTITGWARRTLGGPPRMPEPVLARTARDLEYETQRLGNGCLSTSFRRQVWSWPDEPTITREVSFILPTDTMYYGALDERATRLGYAPLPMNKDVCHPRDLAKMCGSQSVACWWSPEILTHDWVLERGLDAFEAAFIDTWSFLKDISSLQTLWVSWIGSSPGCQTHSRCGEDGIAIRCRTRAGDEEPMLTESQIRLTVNLFEDERIAEILSLDSHVWDCDKPFHTVHSRLGPHCLHCERTRYIETYQAVFPKLWVMLSIEELPTAKRRGVLDNHGRLNKANAWVREKLALMPEIKPYVSFQLFPQTDEEEEETDPYFYEGEKDTVHDYTSVRYRVCSRLARDLYSRHYHLPDFSEEHVEEQGDAEW